MGSCGHTVIWCSSPNILRLPELIHVPEVTSQKVWFCTTGSMALLWNPRVMILPLGFTINFTLHLFPPFPPCFLHYKVYWVLWPTHQGYLYCGLDLIENYFLIWAPLKTRSRWAKAVSILRYEMCYLQSSNGSTSHNTSFQHSSYPLEEILWYAPWLLDP